MGSVLLVTLATYPMCEYSVVGRFIGVVRRRMRSVGLFPQLAIKGSKELGMTARPRVRKSVSTAPQRFCQKMTQMHALSVGPNQIGRLYCI